jgi:hypothetical protein
LPFLKWGLQVSFSIIYLCVHIILVLPHLLSPAAAPIAAGSRDHPPAPPPCAMDAQIHQPRRAVVRGDEDSEPPQGRGGLPKVGAGEGRRGWSTSLRQWRPHPSGVAARLGAAAFGAAARHGQRPRRLDLGKALARHRHGASNSVRDVCMRGVVATARHRGDRHGRRRRSGPRG